MKKNFRKNGKGQFVEIHLGSFFHKPFYILNADSNRTPYFTHFQRKPLTPLHILILQESDITNDLK